jgi:hypothetical protein
MFPVFFSYVPSGLAGACTALGMGFDWAILWLAIVEIRKLEYVRVL